MRASHHTHAIEVPVTFPINNEGDREVCYPRIEVTFSYLPGSPGCWTQRNGDPGWPADPAEIEIIKAVMVDGDGVTDPHDTPDPDPDGTIRDWVNAYLDRDEGYQILCDLAENDHAAMRDTAAEDRMDERRLERE